MSHGYFDVYDVIRERITSGEYAAESALSVDQFMTQFGCDVDTVGRGMEMLVDEGLLFPSSRPDEFVIAAQMARSERQASFSADYSDQGRVPSVSTVHLTVVSSSVDDELHKIFGAKTLIRHLHVQGVDGVPHAIADSYVPLVYLDGVHQELKDGAVDLWELLERAGVPPTRKREAFSYDAPSPRERELLDIVSTPAVRVVRLDCVVWSGDVPVEVCRLVDRADLYQFVYEVDVK